MWWGKEVLGLPIHDNWWQTETGGIMIANTPAMDIKPGSMGKPLPGVEALIVRRQDGAVVPVDEPDVEGELALRAGWPSMFRGYLGQDERYRKCFAGDLYLTGDLARRDADGYFWFVGRADDVIKSAGHLIGPFEVESALMEHPAVAEAGVIGKPDAMVGEVVKAFVSLKQGFEPSEALRMELLGHARKRLGRGGGAEGDRLRADAAAHAQRQDHAPAAEGARTRAARGRHLDAGGRLDDERDLATRPRRRRPARCRSSARSRCGCWPTCCASGAWRRSAPSSTAPARSAASCTCTSARRRWPPARCRAFAAEDNIVATYREHGHALLRGVSMDAIMAEMYGKREGCSRGRGGSMHLFDAATRFFGGNAIVGGGLPLAVGLALAAKLQRERRVTRLLLRRRRGGRRRVPRVDEPGRAVAAAGAVLLREQPLRDGHGARALRVADRPVRQGRGLPHAMRAASTAWTWWRCTRPCRGGRRAVRAGRGPVFLELRTYRFRAHSMFDAELYRDKAEVEAWKTRGPIHTYTARLKAQGLLTEEQFLRIDRQAQDEVQPPWPSPRRAPGSRWQDLLRT